jgi:hypothetical protein
MIKVPLNLYTEKSRFILCAMRDKMLRPSGVDAYTWKSSITNFETDFNGQIVMTIDTDTWKFRSTSWRTRRTPQKIKQFFRNQFEQKIRLIIREVAQYSQQDVESFMAVAWSTKCDQIAFNIVMNDAVIDISFGDLKAIFYALGEIKQLKTKCTKEQLEKLIGEPRDPFQTEMERMRRDEINNIIAEYKAKIDNTWSIQNDELNSMRDAIRAKYEAERVKLNAERDKKIAALETMCNMAIA